MRSHRIVIVVALSACRPGDAAQAIATTPEVDLGGAKCEVAGSERAPFVVEWEASDRGQLEAALRKGVVAVRYSGCELEVLRGCEVPAAYSYSGLTPKRESVEISDADELYARFPRGAVRLEAELERAGSLAVDMIIVGRQEADAVEFARADLQGECADATHLVSGLTVGAFSFHTGRKSTMGASVAVTGVGEAGVGSDHARDELGLDGDVDACEGSSSDDTSSPPGCGALIRLELVELMGLQQEQANRLGHRGLYDAGTPWRARARLGTGLMISSVGGAGLLAGGFIGISEARADEQDDPPKPLNAGLNAAGITMVTLGTVVYFGGLGVGATLLIMAALQRKRVRRDGGLAVVPGGFRFRF